MLRIYGKSRLRQTEIDEKKLHQKRCVAEYSDICPDKPGQERNAEPDDGRAEEAEKRRQWGVLKNTQQWYFYWLRQADSCLLMLPHLPDDVLAVTVPLVEADSTVRVRFERTAPDGLQLPPSW